MYIPDVLTEKETGELLDLVHREPTIFSEFFALFINKQRALQKKSQKITRYILQRERTMLAQILRSIQKKDGEK